MKIPSTPWYHKHLREVKTLEYDHKAVGNELRRRRRALGLSLRNVAKRMRLSAPYLSDLELGRRPWNGARIGVYEMAIRGELCQRDYERLIAHIKNPPPLSDFLIGSKRDCDHPCETYMKHGPEGNCQCVRKNGTSKSTQNL